MTMIGYPHNNLNNSYVSMSNVEVEVQIKLIRLDGEDRSRGSHKAIIRHDREGRSGGSKKAHTSRGRSGGSHKAHTSR